MIRTIILCLLVIPFFTQAVEFDSGNTADIIITQDQIQNSGRNNLGDILRDLTITSASANQFSGNSTEVNFRQLGSQRLVFLINGQQTLGKSDDAFDFSLIPLNMIRELQIYTQSDIQFQNHSMNTPVINIVTSWNDSFVNSSFYSGTSEQGELRTQAGILYSNSNDNNNYSFGLEYTDMETIWARDRDISQIPVYGTGINFFSSSTPAGVFAYYPDNNTPPLFTGECNQESSSPIYCTIRTGSDGIQSVNDTDLILQLPLHRYNFNSEKSLFSPLDRLSAFHTGNFSLANEINVSTQFLVSRNKLTQTQNPSSLAWLELGSVLGSENPYNFFDNNLYSSPVYFSRVLSELGNRIDSKQIDYTHLAFSIDKNLGEWSGTLSYSFNKSSEETTNTGYYDESRLLYSLSNDCLDDASCTPLNLFAGENGLSSDMIHYISQNYSDKTQSNRHNISLIFSKSFQIWSEKITSVAMGLNYRRDDLEGSEFTAWNESLFFSNGTPSSYPAYLTYKDSRNKTKIYSTLDHTLLNNSQGQPLLSTQSAFAVNDFNNTGTETEYQFAIKWQPTHELSLSLRSANSWQQAPIMTTTDNAVSGSVYYDDPCSINPDLPGCPLDDIPYQDTTALAVLTGNNQLKPMKNQSHFLDLRYLPSGIDNLELNLSFYDYKLSDIPRFFDTQEILDACAITATPQYCNQITYGGMSEPISEIRATYINNQLTKISGIDLNVSYTIDTDWGLWKMNLANNYIDNYTSNGKYYVVSSTDPAGLTGTNTVDYTDDQLIPDLKSNLSINWSLNNWQVNYQARYISSYQEPCSFSNSDIVYDGSIDSNFLWCNASANSGESNSDNNDLRIIGGVTFHDINTKYIWQDQNIEFLLGIENVFDKSPPLSSQGEFNFNTQLFDATGRYFWLRLNKTF